jgi:polar amino acid transport system substrate-binding protein
MNIMPVLKQALLAIALLFYGQAGLAATTNANKIIKLAADERCPYSCNAQIQFAPGYLVDIATVIFEKRGYTIDFQLLSWNRAVDEARKGHIDGIVGAYKEEAPDFIFPNDNLGKTTIAFFVRKESNWNYSGTNSLNAVDIGVIDGYSYGERNFDHYVSGFKGTQKIQLAVGEDPLPKNIRKLLLGRIDATLDDITVTTRAIKLLGYTDHFRQAGILSKDNPVYIAFSPNLPESKEYAKILSTGLVELRQSGKLKKILAAYNVVDWQ